MAEKPKKKPEGTYICKCECGGSVRGVRDFGQWFTWCDKCTPVQTVKIPKSGCIPEPKRKQDG